MKRIVIESPYAGDIRTNMEYLHRALRFALRSGVAPFASHALYTTALDDALPEERELGILAGLEFVRDCDETWVFTDYGISGGMKRGIKAAQAAGRPVVRMQIGKNPK